jgi:uncharacterized phage protein gp47/JayE
VQVTAAPTHPFPWSGSHVIGASTTADVEVNGDQSALEGLDVLVNVGTANARGGYVRATVATAVYDGSSTTLLTFAAALAAAPSVGGSVYPCPPFFEEAQRAVFDLFDALTPGDTSPARRVPSELAAGRATLYASRLINAVLSVEGVLGVTLATPSANVTPSAKSLVTLGTFLVRSI